MRLWQVSFPADFCTAQLLVWCGNPRLVLEVWVDGVRSTPRWIPGEHGDLRLPLPPGEHEYCLCRVGSTARWEGRIAAVAAGEWTRVYVGVLFESAVSDPQGRSQFSFDDGRSACSFLVCDAAALLWEALGAGGEIQGAEVTEGHVAAALTRGMQRYADGPRDSLAMMGLDHTSVLEVLEFCGWVWNGELTVVCVCVRERSGGMGEDGEASMQPAGRREVLLRGMMSWVCGWF